ncbi:MAG: cell division protein ZapA [Bacteroidota bacterium]
MEELAVKVRIGGRVYPMKVQAADEKCVRAAGKLVNEQIKTYSDQFGIQDQQDLLAMVALGSLIETLKLKQEVTQETQALEKRVDSLVQLVDQALT